jgi:hypothetical protein
VSLSSVTADFDGNGTEDFTGTALDNVSFAYVQPGLYFPTVTLTDNQGNARTVSTIVEVYDRTGLDLLLQTKWTLFKDALRRGDVEAALQSVAFAERDTYRQLLNGLTVALSNIDAVLRDVSFVSAVDDRAEYR